LYLERCSRPNRSTWSTYLPVCLWDKEVSCTKFTRQLETFVFQTDCGASWLFRLLRLIRYALLAYLHVVQIGRKRAKKSNGRWRCPKYGILPYLAFSEVLGPPVYFCSRLIEASNFKIGIQPGLGTLRAKRTKIGGGLEGSTPKTLGRLLSTTVEAIATSK